MKQPVPKSCEGLANHVELTERDTIEETIEVLNEAANGLPIVAVICPLSLSFAEVKPVSI